MKALMLSAYDAESHVYWRNSLYRAFSRYEWTTLTLPPRYFNWRIRGNGLTWFQNPALKERYDICIATSMVDLATLKGLNPDLASLPTLLYFHENQFAYPVSRQSDKSQRIEAQMVQIYSALCCDVAAFNSEHNRTTFLSGVSVLLKKLPDGVPKGVVDLIREKSVVLPVGIEVDIPNEKIVSTGPFWEQSGDIGPHFVWNHRWEYDKGPDRLHAFLKALPESLNATFHTVGQSFRRIPEEFQDIRVLLESRGWLGAWGYVESKTEYHQLLERADFVLSTSNHDFQGLSVMEAVNRGCIPVLPRRLAYPEIFSDEYLYIGADCIEEEAKSMAAHVMNILALPEPQKNTLLMQGGLTRPEHGFECGGSKGNPRLLACPDISPYLMDNMAPRYRAIFEQLLG